MKSILLLVTMTLVGLGVVGSHTGGPAAATATPVVEAVPAISTNEGGCWDKCKTCEEKCRSQSGDAKRSCDDACWTTNDKCCAAVGGKGVYKMCGCTDK
jgi:hypothetical protein